jgi:sigma-B regulation protein RsbU (phosphoserine phosphatase)
VQIHVPPFEPDDPAEPETHAQLQPGETPVAFTDGATEARSPHGEFFSERRLLSTLTSCAARGASADLLVSTVLEDLVAHMSTATQFDDITVMVVRRLP